MNLQINEVIILEEVIKKIIDIEHKAQSLVSDTKNEKEEKIKAMKNKILDMEKELLIKTDKKVKQLEKREIQEAREYAEKKNIETEKKLKDIEQFARDNIESWIQDIYFKVIE